jgi:DNA repair protein RAD16
MNGPKRRKALRNVTRSVSGSRKSNGNKGIVSVSTLSSNASEVSANDLSNEYETPATSVAATPAELSVSKTMLSTRSKGKGKPRLSRGTSPFTLTTRSTSVVSNKRKRDGHSTADQLLTDEILAQKLQEEEYGDTHVKGEINLRKFGSHTNINSEDSDSYLSEAGSDFTLSELDKPSSSKPAKRTTKKAKLSSSRRISRERKDTEIMTMQLDAFDELVRLENLIGDSEAESAFSLERDLYIETDDQDDASTTDALQQNSAHTNQALGARRSRANRWMSRADRERAKLEKSHPEIVTLWDDLAKIPVIKPERKPQPAGISRQLKPFQLEGVDWMIKQEQSQYHGGLLGDEMGMGKVQSLLYSII